MNIGKACRAEALSYLGCRGNPPPELAAQVEWGLGEVQKLPPPKMLWREFLLERTGGQLTLAGTTLALPGKDLENLLRDCKKALLLAAAMGREAETAIRRIQVKDVGKGLVLDCCISAALETACNEWQAQREQDAAARKEYLTDRFSPGYGDLPLSLQKEFLEILDAPRKIGLCATPEFLLTPRKSATAIVGIANTPQSCTYGGCRDCPRYEACQLRKDGITCGK
mgnify:FL=1